MKNIAKFSAIKEKVSDEKRKIIDLVEDVVTKNLHRTYGKEEIDKKFSGTGIFERVSEESKDDSIDLLNNKITAHIFSVAYKGYRPDVELEFDEKTYLPSDKTAKLMKNPQTWKDPVFQSKFAVVYQDVISPAVQSLAVGFYDELVQVHNIGWGDSYAVSVNSNEIFVVDEVAQDTVKTARQRLLNKTYTAVPRPYGATASVNFYQFASGKVRWDEHILALARGFVKKWNLMSIDALKNTIDEAMVAGGGETPYFRATLNDDNHFGLVDLLEAANDGYRVNVYGSLVAVSKLLPAEGSFSQATQWGERGYVSNYLGTNVYRLRQTLIPGTINNTPVFGAPSDYLWYLTEQVQPIHLVFEGDTLQIERNSFETGDGTLTFTVLSNFDMIYVPATKIGCIILGSGE